MPNAQRGSSNVVPATTLSSVVQPHAFAATSGGRYTAKQEADGKWSVLDVPIFSELPAGERRNEKAIGREWMEAAVKAAKVRAAEGYEAPLHVFHHDGMHQTVPAGRVVFKEVRDVTYEGKLRAAVIVDFVAIPQDIFARIEREEFPYRSVEVHDWDKPEIASVALLNDEVPFFKLAMLTIGTKVQYEDMVTAVQAYSRTAGGAVAAIPFAAYCAKKDRRGAAILFKFDQPEGKGPKEGGAETDDQPKKPKPGEKPAEGAEGKSEDEESPAETISPEAKLLTQAMNLIQTMLTRQDQIAQRLGLELVNVDTEPPTLTDRKPAEQPAPKPKGATGEDGNADGDTDHDDDTDPKTKKKNFQENDMTPEEITKLAADAAEKAVLKRENEQLQAKQKVDGLVAGAVESLKGWNVTDSLKATLRSVAESKDGEANLKLFVDSFKAHTQKDSPATASEAERVNAAAHTATPGNAMTSAGGLTADEEKVVQKFRAKGPREAERVVKLAAQYGQLRGRITAPFEKFVEANINDDRNFR